MPGVYSVNRAYQSKNRYWLSVLMYHMLYYNVDETVTTSILKYFKCHKLIGPSIMKTGTVWKHLSRFLFGAPQKKSF